MRTKGRKLVPFYMLFLMALLVVPSMAQYQRPETLNKPPETFTEPLATDLVINGDFEAGSLTGWTVRDQAGGDGSWFIQRGTMSPESGFLVPAPPQGSFAAMTDQFGPGSHILYQDITLPPSQPATLSFSLYIGNRAGSFVIPTPPTLDFTVVPNQHFRVDIMDPSAPVDSVTTGVLKNVYITNPGDPLESGYTTITASLDAFAGRQIRLRFAEVDNQLFFQVGIDKVIVAGAGPTVGGSVTGVSPTEVICQNLTTGQQVAIQDGARSWDCEAAGLVVNPGDIIQQTVTGPAD